MVLSNFSPVISENVEKAMKILKNEGFVLIYDGEGREEETDIVIASQFVESENIKFMRKNGGGLICTTLPMEFALKLKLPYLHEIFEKSGLEIFRYLKKDVRYDTSPAFSITINHVDNYTGISDRERAKTIQEFAKFLGEIKTFKDPVAEFGKRFISPGHVHLLIATDISKRRGHTELSTYLMKMAGLIPSAAIVEMLGDDGYSLYKNDAKKFAKTQNIPFLEGHEIVDAWSKWSE